MTNIAGTGNSLSGQYGDMPFDMYLRKIEQSCEYENPHQVEDYQRSLMKDFKPDDAFFESDQPRGGNDSNGTPRGGYQSTAQINLRSGGRTLDDPYLPDGTFTDWQFMEKDERGFVTEPNMRKHVEQQYARGKNYNYRNDADNSVPSEGINPWDMQMGIRNAQNITKDYFKIFSTAYEGWTNGSVAPGYSRSKREILDSDQILKDPVHRGLGNRGRMTSNLSNDTSIGWRRTVDHRFKVAKYGRTNTSKSFTSEDWWKNRANVIIDHDQLVSNQGNNVNKSLALLMIDLSQQRKTHRFAGIGNIDFNESNADFNKKRKLTPADMSGMANRPTKESQDETPHTLLKGEVTNTSGEKLIIRDVTNMGKTIMNPTIVEKMSNINRANVKHSTDDLRNSIQKSTVDKGIYIEDFNTKRVKTIDPKAVWNSLIVYKKGESKVVKNYKSAVKKMISGGKVMDKVSKDIDFKESYKTNQRRGKFDSKKMNINSTNTDNKYGIEAEGSNIAGPMGSKYMTGYIKDERDINDLDDMMETNKSFVLDNKPYEKKNYMLK
jgi:hypothetical protein